MIQGIQHANVCSKNLLNPFISISDTIRIIVVVYFILWRLFPSFALYTGNSQTPAIYMLSIVCTVAITEVLILLPFFFRSFAGTPIGLLHPLIMPTLISLMLDFIKNPELVLNPISIWYGDTTISNFYISTHLPPNSIIEAHLRRNVINLVSIIFTYVGFVTICWRTDLSSSRLIELNGGRLTVLYILFLLVVLFFLQQQGGLLTHMASLASGRFRMRELSGHILVVNSFLPILLILWYAHRPNALSSYIYVAAFILATVLQFLVSGSRSGLFIPVAMLLAIWMFHNRRLPTVRAFILGLVAVLLVGILGDVRRSGNGGEVDFSALTQFNLESALENSKGELKSRKKNTGLAIAALVPEQQKHLYGATYVAAATFWLPRSVWRNKPRGAGAHAAALLYSNRSSMEGYSGGGFPVHGTSEAYWNFGYLGVVVIFFFYGIVLKLTTHWVLCDRHNPFAIVFLVLVVFSFTDPATTIVVPFFQKLVLLYITLIYVGRWRVMT